MSGVQLDTDPITLTIIQVDVHDGHFRLDYAVQNNSTREIWVCDSMDAGSRDFEAIWGEDGRTFVLRKRVGLRWDAARDQPLARYIRLRAGTGLSESLVLPLPVQVQTVVSGGDTSGKTDRIQRIALEIGYYIGSLRGLILDLLEKQEFDPKGGDLDVRVMQIRHFNEINEYLEDSEAEVLYHVSPTDPLMKMERVLRASINTEPIPRETVTHSGQFSCDLRDCNRLEFSFEPSALEYFFPYEDQISLLSSAEIQHLRSVHSVIVDERRDIEEFTRQIMGAFTQGVTVGRARVRATCFHAKTPLAELDIYRDCFLSSTGEPFQMRGFQKGYKMPFLSLSPDIEPYILRMRCAENLTVLYRRLRLLENLTVLYRRLRLFTTTGQLHKTESNLDRDNLYPAPANWGNSIVNVYSAAGMLSDNVNRAFRCPGVDEGKCHYAMNPNCRYSSPSDMVLLFETKAGWNQHGGPELFAFDNHDPRGGLVLLNDGTVKFIRTEEELKQLRWK